MQKYYVDLRTYSESDHDRIIKLANDFAWDVYLIANLPKVYEIMWDIKEPISEILEIPKELISVYPPHNM